MELYLTALKGVIEQSGFVALNGPTLVMLLVAFILLYLAIAKGFEPLLLMPIAFGCLLVNLPLSGIVDPGGFLYFVKFGIDHEIYPVIIFMGIGALTDFGPLLANPITFLLGASAQLGVFVAVIGAMCMGFTIQQAAGIGIIGGADGPTAIYLCANEARARHTSGSRRRGVQLHVARPAHPAAGHQASHDEERPQHKDGAASPRNAH